MHVSSCFKSKAIISITCLLGNPGDLELVPMSCNSRETNLSKVFLLMIVLGFCLEGGLYSEGTYRFVVEIQQ
jgi:hypothetical protein